MDIIISGNQDIIYKIKNMPEELNRELDKHTLENQLQKVLKSASSEAEVSAKECVCDEQL